MNHDVFISHSGKQKNIANDVCRYLEENGFKCWMSSRDIPAGSDYTDLLDEAIKSCKIVVLVFSKSASDSQWVKSEINVAFSEKKPIIPFRVDQTEIEKGFRVMLNPMHRIDAYPQYADKLPDLKDSICEILGRSLPSAPRQSADKPRPVKKKIPVWVMILLIGLLIPVVIFILQIGKSLKQNIQLLFSD